jgi:hypothetical protein
VIELTNSSGRELASALMSTVPVALSGGGFFGDPAPKMPTGDTAKPERDTGKGTTARHFTSGTQMIWRKRNCISTRRNSVMRSSDILSGVEGRYENVERDVNIE